MMVSGDTVEIIEANSCAELRSAVKAWCNCWINGRTNREEKSVCEADAEREREDENETVTKATNVTAHNRNTELVSHQHM